MADEIKNNTSPPEEPLTRIEEYLDAIMQNTANYDTAVILKNKSITANGTYSALSEDYDGYEGVDVNVPNSFTPADEGKVVSNGSLVAQTSTAINTNGTVDTTLINSVDVNVPNTYTQADEGKVVNNGALTAQTSTSTTQNGTLDTTLYNSVNVNVPNTYTAQDEGKVVDNGALVAQTAMSNTITANDTYDTTLYNSVTVNVPTGGSGVEEKDVNFYDYDGTVLYSYTTQEFLALTEMPANPSHEGLTAQGWNWSFSNATYIVTNYGKLNIGQMYTTDNGDTRIHITLYKGRLSPYLGFGVNGTATINWGDNSVSETVTGTSVSTNIYTQHIYTTPGDYEITISVASGSSIGFYGYSRDMGSSVLVTNSTSFYNDIYRNCVTKVELGSSVTLGSYSFGYMKNLNSFMLPYGTSQINGLYCWNYTNISVFIVPTTVTRMEGYQFQYSSIKAFVFSQNYYTMTQGQSMFNNCKQMKLGFTYGVRSGVANAYGFSYSGVNEVICIRNSSGNYSITPITDCQNLTYLNIPYISDIASTVLNNCTNLSFIRFDPNQSTPPSKSGAFSGIPIDCIIYVPALVSNKYMTASNYPNPSTYNYIGYATYSSGDTLPTLTTDETYTLTWYATVDDAIAETNPITTGNGNEVYSRATAVV